MTMRQRLSHSLRLVVLAGAGALIFAGGSSAGPRPAPRHDSSTILVKFKIGNAQAQVAAAGDRVVGQTKTRVLIVEVHGRTLDQALMGYALRPDVQYAEPNFIASAALDSPNDPSYASQWALSKINALGGWSTYPGSFVAGGGPTIAIVDSGVDSSHPDLADGRVLISSGANCTSGTCIADPALDDYGHGTHVAGIAAAATNNGEGVAGLAYSSSILPVKVLDSAGNGSYASIANGIIWAADHGARVINLSISGSAYAKTMCDAVTYAISAGAVVVAAAGNDSTFTNEYPAACAGAVGVAATNSNDQPAAFSDYGYPDVFLSAPGVAILSTGMGGGYLSADGTSMAAPFVSGLSALLVGQNPARTPADVKRILAGASDKVGSGAYSNDRFNVCGGSCTWSSSYGYGRIDVAQALSGQSVPDFSVSASPSSVTVFKGGTATYSVATAAAGGFSGTASLSVSGLPAGATPSFSASPISVGGSSTLTVATTTSILPGTYTLTISAVSGTSTRTAPATLVVSGPDFSVSLSPSTVTVARGSSTIYTVSSAALGGFSGTATLSAAGAPTGGTAKLSKTSITVGGSTTLTVSTASTTLAGTYTLTVTATGGGKTHTASASLVVVIPDFTLSVTPASATVAHGASAVFTVSVSPINLFAGIVSLSATGVPTNGRATFSKTSITKQGSVTLTISTASTTPAGSYTVTVKGLSGTTLTHTVPIALTVT